MPADRPFWKTKTLGQMTDAEWESLCDGCGRCCLHKLREEETDRIIHTEVSCRLLDTDSCLCSDYPRRRRKVPDCVRLTPAALAGIDWLPPTCGYRRIADGLELEWWHPLVSGSPDSVHQAGVSVRGRAISERVAGPLEDHVADWPGEPPAQVRSGLPRPGPDEVARATGSDPVRSDRALSGPDGFGPPRSGLVPVTVPPAPGPAAPARPAPVRPTIRRMPAAGRAIPR